MSAYLSHPLRTEAEARAAVGVSVAIKGDAVLLIRRGPRSGYTRCGDLADELTTERATAVAKDILAAVNVIETRKAREARGA